MRANDLETLDPEALAARFDEVVAFLEGAGSDRDLAAAGLAVGRVHGWSGRPVEAFLALREAAGRYEAAGDDGAAARARDEAAAAAREAFPAFVGSRDLDEAFDGLCAARVAAAEAWSRRAPGGGDDGGDDAMALRVRREAFLRRLAAGADVAGPPVSVLVDRFGLSAADGEILLLLHRIESDGRWDRAIRAPGREDFLPCPTVRYLCRFLSGTGVVDREDHGRLLPSAPLAQAGLVALQPRDGDGADDTLGAGVRLSPDVHVFLSGATGGDLLAATGLVAPGPGENGGGAGMGAVRAFVDAPDGARRLLLLASGLRQPLDDMARAAAEAGRVTAVLRARIGDRLDPRGPIAGALRVARLAGALPVLVLREAPTTRAASQDESPRPAVDAPAWLEAFAVRLHGAFGPVAIVAPRDLGLDLLRTLESCDVVEYPRPDPGALVEPLAAELAARGVDVGDLAPLRAVLASETIDPDDLPDLAREVAALQRASGGGPLSPGVLHRVARARAKTVFSGIAERLSTAVDWSDLILPEEVLTTLNDVITFARYRDRVLNDWGFAEKMPYGKALSALFHGPPGTGKTLTACVLANDLGVDLYRVDLSQVVSKWIGETEKNLARVFDAASRTRAILLFDEADALFGKRTEVRTAVDRYSNLEVNYLLQRLEDFEGLTILTTNSPENIDAAFRRRIRFKIAFPFPDAGLRADLWRRLIPPRVPLAGPIDFKALATSFEFVGAHVRNALLRAAFRAASEDRGLTEMDIFEAGRAEAREAGILVRSP